MKVLIGTPTHEVKDYAMKQWLAAVEKVDYKDCELYLVDNSPTPEYSKYLETIAPKNIKTTVIYLADIPHIDPEERVSFAREEIRKKVLSEDFDWWFSWECDTIAPSDVLKKLLKYGDKFPVVHHTSPSRVDPNDYDGNTFGISLVHKRILSKFAFTYEWGKIDPLMTNTHHGTDSWFNRRVIRSGEKIIDITGIVKPIEHLNK